MIGANAVILEGVKIGDGAVVAAGSVVMKMFQLVLLLLVPCKNN